MFVEQHARARDSISPDSGCIAFIEIACRVAGLEPLLALRCRSVRPLLGHDTTLRLLLDAIVADGRRGVERLRDLRVRGLYEVSGVGGVLRPDPRKAVGLELETNGLRVRARLQQEVELVLDVVAVLVGHDISLRERPALRAEALGQILEEAQVEIDLLVIGAIEGSARGLREAARTLRRARVQDGLRG